MDTIFNFLRKTLVLSVATVFVFAVLYVPQPHNQIETAHAQFAVTEVGPSGAANISVAQSTLSLQAKEYGLDGIGWVLGKAIVSSMVASTIEWINSGFDGSPAFVQDLGDFLLNVADEVAGAYIETLGGNLSFLCSPFQLDIQIALALEYQVAREKKPYEGCTLTGVIDNIESFLDGNFSDGGWDDWFDITMNPQIYTPYGQLMEARAGMQAAITDAQGNEVEFLRFGKGFLSGEVCETIDTPDGPKEKCKVSLPGQVIADKINTSLGAGQDALISADELNEVIAALLGQVAQKALTGAAGLLGLSANTGYTYQGFDSGSFTGQLIQDANTNIAGSLGSAAASMTTSLQLQQKFRTLATSYASQFNRYRRDFSLEEVNRQAAQTAYDQTQAVIQKATEDAFDINVAITKYNQLETEFNTQATTDARKQQIRTEQATILNTFNSQRYYTQADYNGTEASWKSVVTQIQNPTP